MRRMDGKLHFIPTCFTICNNNAYSSTSTIERAGDLSYDMSEVPVVNSSLQQSKLGIP
jgi:hypothetical protein